MNKVITGAEKKVSIDEVLKQSDKVEETIPVFINHNLGHKTLVATMSFSKFIASTVILNSATLENDERFKHLTDAQRDLAPKHAYGLCEHILKGLLMACSLEDEFENNEKAGDIINKLINQLNPTPYAALQPFTCHLRENVHFKPKSENETFVRLYFSEQSHLLYVMDGQHRREAIKEVLHFIDHLRSYRNYYYKSALGKSSFLEHLDDQDKISSTEIDVWEKIYSITRNRATISMEIHLELNQNQERQLFYDLNNKQKSVEKSLGFAYDEENPINLWVKDELTKSNILKPNIVDKDQKDWSKDPGEITRKELSATNAILFLNKTSINTAKVKDVVNKKGFGIKFWKVINDLKDFGEKGAKTKTVLAQSVVLKAIAKLAYTFGYHKKDKNETNLRTLWAGLKDFDFSHQNPLWNYYNMEENERDKKFEGLKSYLPVSEGNRDMGSYTGKDFRFGAKHNDIFPLIGDMIRWKLGLPPRKHKAQKK